MQNKLYELIFFITSRCNSRCEHCFNWMNVNQSSEMTLAEIERRAGELPEIENLLLSGGEPFMRDDLLDIVKIFKEKNNIRTLSIPTNGLLGVKIAELTEKILSIKELDAVNINFSLDGLENTHDKIRGVPNNFKISIESIKKLRELKSVYPRLHIMANSVVGKRNYLELIELAEFLKENKLVDNHYFEIIRPHKDSEDKFEVGKNFYNKILFLQYYYFKKGMREKNFIKNIAKKILFLGKHDLIYRTQHKNYKNNKKWMFPCTAGKNIFVLESAGKIKPCEIREKSFEFDSYKQEIGEELKDIKNQKCACTHICFLDASIKSSILARYLLIPFFGLLKFTQYEIIRNHPNL